MRQATSAAGRVVAATLDRPQASIAEAAERLGPAVVGLGRGWGHGSGVVVAEGRVLTTAHNVRQGELSIAFFDGRREPGSVTGVDPDLDLALVAVDTADLVPVDGFAAEGHGPGIGDLVLTLANPGGRGLRVTHGYVAAAPHRFRGPRGRVLAGGIEHTAPLPRGSSGAPLVGGDGTLWGVNTVRLDDGLILAMPVAGVVRERTLALLSGNVPHGRTMGVAVSPPRAARRLREAVGLPARDGVLVREVESGSAAERAGIEAGDLIAAVDGRPVGRVDALYAALDGTTRPLRLTLVRGNEEREVTVFLPEP